MNNDIVIIHEDKDFLALAKPAGIAVHGGKSVRGETLVDWLIAKYPEVKRVGDDPTTRPGIVHRLDKETSGVMVVARNQKTFEVLKQLFKARQVRKTYLALVVGAPKKSGVIDAAIGRQIRNPLKRGVGRGIRAERAAITRYRVLENFSGFSLVEVKPETGRMHQIRVHFASIGHPIASDRIYGGARALAPGLERQFLHAASLSFSYPEGRRWQFEASLPEELDAVLKSLRRARNIDKRRRM